MVPLDGVAGNCDGWEVAGRLPGEQTVEIGGTAVARVHEPGPERGRRERLRARFPGARVVCFGHMGDGNLHFNISQPVGADGAVFLERYHDMNKAVHDVVRSLSGSISAEHGIGTLKREELIATAPPVAIDLMRRVKQAFDPLGIMNPGKVI